MYCGYIQGFRGAAILLIVGGHTLFKTSQIIGWSDYQIPFTTISVLIANGTTLFVLVAGFLFQHLSPKYSYFSYMKKKVRYVIVPYILVSIPAITLSVSGHATGPTPFEDVNVWKQIFLFYLTGAHLLPLWFIPMIGTLYVVSPILIQFARQPRLFWLLVPLLLVSTMVPRNLESIPQMLVHFTPVYILGMWISAYKESVLRVAWRCRYILVFLYVVLVAIDIYFSLNTPQQAPYVQPINLWQKIALSFLLIVFFWRHEKFVVRRFSRLADSSFGIYFLHHYLNIVLGSFVLGFLLKNVQPSVAGAVALFGLLFVCVTALSHACVWVMRAVFGKNSRLLIGS